MKRPWFKQPRGLGTDLRYLSLSVEGALAYHAACLHADDDGTLWGVGSRDAVGTLANVLASRRPGADPVWARAAVEECVDVGLLDVSEDGTVLRVVEWVEDAPGAPAEGRRPVATADERAAAAAALRASKRPPGRPPKGAAPMTALDRKRKERFEGREGSFREVPPGVTWEEWCALEAVTKPAAGHVTKLPDGRHETREAVTKLRHETPSRNSVGGRAVSEPSESSGTQRAEKRREEEGDPDAPAPSRNSVTKLRHETPGVGHETPGRDEAGPRLSTTETLSAVDGADLMARLAAVVVVGGRTRIFLRGGPQTEMAFVELVRALVRRGHATVDQVIAAVAHGARLSWVATAKRPVDLSRVCERDGELLVEWLNDLDRAPPATPGPVRASRRAALAVDAPALSPAEAAARLAALKGGQAPATAPTTTQAPTEGAPHHG